MAERPHGEAWAEFVAGLGYQPDDYQLQACAALEAGRGVLVAAPTGAGKTMVAEFGAALALAQGRKLFYTTPIKALSNQKHRELCRRFGEHRVGLLTGEVSLRGEAPIVVMTTEVLRNMLYASSPTLAGLGYVVLDEVHYLADAERGGTWEEVAVLAPDGVQFISLSATISNAAQFGAWLTEVTGPTDLIVTDHRPVPLYRHVMVEGHLRDLTTATRTPTHRVKRTHRVSAITALDAAALLPAIYFIFSRDGCEAAVGQLLSSKLSLNSPAEAERVDTAFAELAASLSPADRAAIGLDGVIQAARRGIAAHHAGLLPVVKQHIEELFQAGLLKAVFATETLALGINMPARSVVLESLVKWNGQAHAEITPAEFTQLTGRAGRRGIDVEGHAIVMVSPGMDVSRIAEIAHTGTFPLNSSFKATASMVVGLVAQMGAPRAERVLAASFGQFQAEESVVRLERQAQAHREQIAKLSDELVCSKGDFSEYADLRFELSRLEKQAQASRARTSGAGVQLRTAKPGTVVRITQGRDAGLAVIVQQGRPNKQGHTSAWVVTGKGQYRRITQADGARGLHVLGEIALPRRFDPRQARDRKIVLQLLRSAQRTFREGERTPVKRDPRIDELRAQLRAHPCHSCPDRETHARLGEQLARLRAEEASLSERVALTANSLTRQFRAIGDLLRDLGYLEGIGEQTVLTPAGEILRHLYSEHDLLLAEAIRRGMWDGLGPAELAGVLSLLVHSSRSGREGDVPAAGVRLAIDDCVGLWLELAAVQRRHQVAEPATLDASAAAAIAAWVDGSGLAEALDKADLTAGDFVRLARQIIDLLGQIAHAPVGASLLLQAQRTRSALARGVVGMSAM